MVGPGPAAARQTSSLGQVRRRRRFPTRYLGGELLRESCPITARRNARLELIPPVHDRPGPSRFSYAWRAPLKAYADEPTEVGSERAESHLSGHAPVQNRLAYAGFDDMPIRRLRPRAGSPARTRMAPRANAGRYPCIVTFPAIRKNARLSRRYASSAAAGVRGAGRRRARSGRRETGDAMTLRSQRRRKAGYAATCSRPSRRTAVPLRSMRVRARRGRSGAPGTDARRGLRPSAPAKAAAWR